MAPAAVATERGEGRFLLDEEAILLALQVCGVGGHATGNLVAIDTWCCWC